MAGAEEVESLVPPVVAVEGSGSKIFEDPDDEQEGLLADPGPEPTTATAAGDCEPDPARPEPAAESEPEPQMLTVDSAAATPEPSPTLPGTPDGEEERPATAYSSLSVDDEVLLDKLNTKLKVVVPQDLQDELEATSPLPGTPEPRRLRRGLSSRHRGANSLSSQSVTSIGGDLSEVSLNAAERLTHEDIDHDGDVGEMGSPGSLPGSPTTPNKPGSTLARTGSAALSPRSPLSPMGASNASLGSPKTSAMARKAAAAEAERAADEARIEAQEAEEAHLQLQAAEAAFALAEESARRQRVAFSVEHVYTEMKDAQAEADNFGVGDEEAEGYKASADRVALALAALEKHESDETTQRFPSAEDEQKATELALKRAHHELQSHASTQAICVACDCNIFSDRVLVTTGTGKEGGDRGQGTRRRAG